MGVLPEGPPTFTYVDPNAAPWNQSPEPPPDVPAQFTYVQPGAPWMGQPMVNNPYGDLVGPQGSPVGPQDFAPATTTASYSGNPYGALDVPDRPAVPLPPRRPAPVIPRAAVPLPPSRPGDLQATTDEAPATSASVADSYQLSPDHPVAQLLTGFEHAVSGGIKWLTDTLGFTNSGVQTGDGVRALASGQHALTDEEHDAVLKSFDPDGKLTPGIRNMMGMNAVYEYYLTHGQKDKAQEMAAGMLEYSKQYLQKSADAALAAPNPIAGGKILAQGINQVPGAPQVEVDDNGNFIQKDPVNGKVVNGGRINPQQLLAIATGAKNGTLFWQSLSKYAHSDDKADEKQTAQQKNLQDIADRRERFDKVMGFVPPDADKPAPGAVPVSGAGTPAAAGEPEESDDGDATEGRSASATQAIPTTPTAAIPKGVNKPAAQSAYVNMSPILDDEIAKNPEARKIWNEMSNPERQDARMVHNARVARALEQAKIEQAKNAPDAPIKRTQASADKIQEQVDSAYTDHVEELKDKKDENGQPMKVPPPSAARAFKGIAREIAKANPDTSGADAVDKTGSLVDFDPKKGMPFKFDKDKNGWFAQMNDTGEPIRLTPSGKVQLQRITNAKIAAADAAKQAAEEAAAKPSRVDAATGKIAEGYRGLPPATPQQVIAERAARRYPQVAPAPVVPAAPAIPPRDWGWPSVR
jgi:hypothetical protein